MVRILVVGFVLSLLGLLVWFAYFATVTGRVFERLSAVEELALTAVLSGGVCLVGVASVALQAGRRLHLRRRGAVPRVPDPLYRHLAVLWGVVLYLF